MISMYLVLGENGTPIVNVWMLEDIEGFQWFASESESRTSLLLSHCVGHTSHTKYSTTNGPWWKRQETRYEQKQDSLYCDR